MDYTPQEVQLLTKTLPGIAAQLRGTLANMHAALSSGDTPQEQLDRQALAQAISAFLRSEDAESRMLFLRRYWYSDPIKDIAKRCGLRESTVKSRLFRIRGRLKDYLLREGFHL